MSVRKTSGEETRDPNKSVQKNYKGDTTGLPYRSFYIDLGWNIKVMRIKDEGFFVREEPYRKKGIHSNGSRLKI